MPQGWGRHSWTLHRNYLLPINSNVGQDEKDALMAGDENTNPSPSAPPVGSESADTGPSGTVTSSTAGSTPQVVWINLLYLDVAHEKPRTDSHGGTGISVWKQVPGHPTSGMHGLVFMPYQVCTMPSGEV